MGYSTVPYVNSGDSWTAAQHNTYIRDNFAALWQYTDKGDIAIASSGYSVTKLPIGPENSILINSSDTVSWGNLSQIYCQLEMASTSISTASWRVMTYNVVKDDYSMINPSYSSRIYAPYTGIYYLSGGVYWSSNSSQTREVKYYNGYTNKTLYIDTQGAGLTNTNNISIPVSMAAGSYVEVAIYQGSGSSLNATSKVNLTYWGS